MERLSAIELLAAVQEGVRQGGEGAMRDTLRGVDLAACVAQGVRTALADETAADVEPGRYRNYLSGRECEVVAVAEHTETGEPLVVHRALGSDRWWARSVPSVTSRFARVDGEPAGEPETDG